MTAPPSRSSRHRGTMTCSGFVTASGLVDETGTGPIVVAGHTPTHYVERLYGAPPALDENGLCRMLFCGAGDETGWIPDKIAIDYAAAAGAGIGQVGMICLDTLEVTYEAILDDE